MISYTFDECRREIAHLRALKPDYDELEVESINPETGIVAARLRFEFRAPFRARRQDDPQNDPDKWKYVYSVTEEDSARVLHEFLTTHDKLNIDFSLWCSAAHDKYRDAQLRQQAERAADEDAILLARIEAEMSG